METPRIGLALGSGSARGWAHLGVLKALREKGLEPTVVAGASVGALVGAAYASGQVEPLASWARTLTKVDVWTLLDATFSGGGMMRGNRLMQAISEQIEDRRIETMPIAFGAVAADLVTGQEVWLRSGRMLRAVRASSGLPGLFAPVSHEERWLIDGGVVNPVPVSLCRAMGAEYIIAVNLNRTLSGRRRVRHAALHDEEPESGLRDAAPAETDGPALLERWTGLVDGLVGSWRSGRHREPGLFEVMATSINIMQDRITRSRMVGDPPYVVISPELVDFQLMDFHRADEAIAIGYEATQRADTELRELAEAVGTH
jgi:NTE family protein